MTRDSYETKYTHKSLPGWTYNNNEFFQLELEELFYKSWQLIGHTSQFKKPGDYGTLEIGNISALAVLGKDGKIRGFANVCPHRATKLLDGPHGNCGSLIKCPYHSWVFELTGQLRGIPHERKDFPDFDKSKHGLLELEIEEFLGLVFIKLGGDNPPPSVVLQPFLPDLEVYRLDEMVQTREVEEDHIDADWKILVENHLDAEHIRGRHPAAFSLIGDRFEETIAPHGAWRSILPIKDELSPFWSARNYQKFLPNYEYLPQKYQRKWLIFSYFPSLAIFLYPEGMDTLQFLPAGPGRTIGLDRGFTLPNQKMTREKRVTEFLSNRVNMQVVKEDDDIVQRGQNMMHGGYFKTGPLSEGQKGTRDFMRMLREAIPIATHDDQPRLGTVAEKNAALTANRS